MTKILLTILILLQLADGWTTYRILSEGGREKNPAVRWLMERIGMLHGLLASKTLAIIAVVIVYVYLPILLIPLAIIYGWVVWHNWRQMK